MAATTLEYPTAREIKVNMDHQNAKQINDPVILDDAARTGDLVLIKSLVERGINVGAANYIHEAAKNDHHECLDFILNQDKSNIGYVNEEGVTSLLVACMNNSLRCVEVLLEHGADPNQPGQKNVKECTYHMCKVYPIMIAAKARSLSCVELLLSHGATVDVRHAHHEFSPVHMALCDGFDYLIEKHKFSPKQHNQTALYKTVKLLVRTAREKGVDLVSDKAYNDETPLYYAARGGHYKCVEFLLKNGADPDVISYESTSYTPLLAALEFRHPKCFLRLCPITSLAAIKKCERGVFEVACKHPTDKYLRLLIDQGFDVNLRHRLPFDVKWHYPGLTDSHYAAFFSKRVCPLTLVQLMECDTDYLQVLLEAGANPNATGRLEIPPLLVALSYDNAYDENLDSVELLLKYGAKVNLYHPRIQGNLSLIVCLNDWERLKLMLQHGAEADSLFHFPQPHTYCPAHDEPSSQEDENSHWMNESCDFFDEEETALRWKRNLMYFIRSRRYESWPEFKAPVVIMFLLLFTANVRLDPRIESLMKTPDQWNRLLELTESPRSLKHYCRHAFRAYLTTNCIQLWQYIPALPLPPTIRDYLLYWHDITDMMAQLP